MGWVFKLPLMVLVAIAGVWATMAALRWLSTRSTRSPHRMG